MISEKLFFQAHPEQIIETWCSDCYENTEQIRGVLIGCSGVELASMCRHCGSKTAVANSNMFADITGKLDKLLIHLGIGRYD